MILIVYKITISFAEIDGVELEISEEDACKIERIISNETYNGLKNICIHQKN